MQAYKTGDSDERPWGRYVVTAVGTNEDGEEYCEKDITVLPGKILSLQSHEFRRERWTVKEGILTVLIDGRVWTLSPGGSADIGIGSLHCMANLGGIPCVVHELQQGLCREEDIRRYIDAYGRATAPPENAAASIAAYDALAAAVMLRPPSSS